MSGAREFRVFVSSTFADMRAERDELTLRIFPQLRTLCEARGVVWSEIDLRWGVTDEQKAEGKVLPICLDAIDRCRPYFIALLGERYGWTGTRAAPDLLKRYPWLATQAGDGTSITHVEIMHAALNHAERPEGALFYLRDPDYVLTQPAAARAELLPASEEERDRIAALKAQIRNGGFRVRENFASAAELGQMVLADLTEIIDRRFPEQRDLPAVERERLDHEAFAESRGLTHVRRAQDFARLDAFTDSSATEPLAVIGEAGLGKTSLLANWALDHRRRHPDDAVVVHFVGNIPGSDAAGRIVRRIMTEVQARFGMTDPIPQQLDDAEGGFASWLARLTPERRAVVVIDALDQLPDIDDPFALAWLPQELPDHVKLVLSTRPGAGIDALRRQGWTEITAPLVVTPMQIAERRHLAQAILSSTSRTLSDALLDRLVQAPQSGNPLYLSLIVDELRQVATHASLQPLLDDYLETTTPADLFKKILQRWHSTYDDGRDLVRRTMRLIWVSRYGLSETELRLLLGTAAEPLPQEGWAPFFHAARHALTSASGLLHLAHDYLRQAVAEQCFDGPDAVAETRHRLVQHFRGASATRRQIEEYPWQLARLGDCDALRDVLESPAMFVAAWTASQADVIDYWHAVEAAGAGRLTEAYAPVIDGRAEWYDPIAQEVISFPADRKSDDEFKSYKYVNSLSELFERAGLRERDIALLESHRQRFERIGEALLARALGGRQLLAYIQIGDIAAAERIAASNADEFGEGFRLEARQQQAALLLMQNRLDEGMALLEEDDAGVRAHSEPELLCNSLINRCHVLLHWRRYDEALRLIEEAVAISRNARLKAEHLSALANLGVTLRLKGRLNEAIAIHEDQEAQARAGGFRLITAQSLAQQGLVLVAQGEPAAADAKFAEQEAICREIKDAYWLDFALNQRASIAEQADPATAFRQLEERVDILIRTRRLPEAFALLIRLARLAAGSLRQPARVADLLDQAAQHAQDEGQRRTLSEARRELLSD